VLRVFVSSAQFFHALKKRPECTIFKITNIMTKVNTGFQRTVIL